MSPRTKQKNYYWLLSCLLSVGIVVFVLFKYHPDIIKYTERLTSTYNFLHTTRSISDQYVFVHLSSMFNGPRLRGRIIEEQNVKLAQFLGIRYAEKPARFRKARSVRYWTGTKDALKWPPFCMQNKLDQYDYLTKVYNYNISEDCLYLNIWSPLSNVIDSNRWIKTNGDKLLPVIIFIHGGAFSYMGISMEAYYGGVISSIGNVVFVTINYRVGLFGFFDNDLEINSKNNTIFEYDKNVGLYDQIVAIEWIRKNIHHFGGDPNRITLQGQSAGAISIGLLMISPASRNLFKRAILQSASPMMIRQIFTSTHYSRVVQLANCSVELLSENHSPKKKDDKYEDIDYNFDHEDQFDDYDDYQMINVEQRKHETECIERLSANKVNQIQRKMLEENTMSFSPSIPSRLLPDYAEDQSANIIQKDILIGANANESTLYLHQEAPDIMPLTPDFNLNLVGLMKLINKLDHDLGNMKKFSSLILDRFKRENIVEEKDIVKHFIIFLSDLMFKGPVFKFAKLLSMNRKRNVYLYLFNEKNSMYPKWIGSPHWNEMDYVFGIPLLHKENFTKKQQQLSIRIIKTWTHFARTGEILPQNGIDWPRLDNKNIHMNLMSNNISIGYNLDMMFYSIFDLLYDST